MFDLQTIEFELRKLEASQATEHVKLLLSFMPNSFLVGGGEFLSNLQMHHMIVT